MIPLFNFRTAATKSALDSIRLRIAFLIIFFTVHVVLVAQGGVWTHMNGPASANQPVVYGTQGVPSPANRPPASYEPAEWTDTQGRFWMYGGWQTGPGLGTADVWSFDPQSSQWTWMHGPGTPVQAGVYGTQGIPSPTNHPGIRLYTTATIADSLGNLWLFGGAGYDAFGGSGPLNDLWRYDIATNEWTWMKGSPLCNSTGSTGTQGVPAMNNNPRSRAETTAFWCGPGNQLWLYGGADFTGAMGDTWRYDIATNIWTWMGNSPNYNEPPLFGTLGVPSNGRPGARSIHGRWKDRNGDFWIMGGGLGVYLNRNDLWRFQPQTSAWTWMNGPSVGGDRGVYGPSCVQDSSLRPGYRDENRASVVDPCGRFWNMGGFREGYAMVYNDLWVYSPTENEWMLAHGDTTFNIPPTYGTFGQPSPTNSPGSRDGSVAWVDKRGDLWFYGGFLTANTEFNDMWRFHPDYNCLSSLGGAPVLADFAPSQLTGCTLDSIDFLNQSLSASTYHWEFGDGDTSNIPSPSHAFQSPGQYAVQLIVQGQGCIGQDADTFTVTISILASPQVQLPADTVLCADDSLLIVATGSGFNSLLWSNGSSSNAITVSDTGIYSVQVFNGPCVATDEIHIGFLPSPVLQLQGQDTLCQNETLLLEVGIGAAFTYLWQDGSIDSSYLVVGPGTYWAEIGNACGSIRDSILVLSGLGPILDLGPDSMYCGADSIVLNALVPDGHYQWSTGDTTPTITVLPVGTFSVTVTDLCGTASDTITIRTGIEPLSSLGPDREICKEETIQLDGGQQDASFLWSTGDTSASISISNPGQYWLRVENECGIVSDTISITIKADSNFYVPNVFTPNGDGISDCFGITVINPSEYALSIFDRWGKRLFFSTNPQDQWCGDVHGQPSPEGVYFLIVRTTDCHGILRNQPGILSLLR